MQNLKYIILPNVSVDIKLKNDLFWFSNTSSKRKHEYRGNVRLEIFILSPIFAQCSQIDGRFKFSLPSEKLL